MSKKDKHEKKERSDKREKHEKRDKKEKKRKHSKKSHKHDKREASKDSYSYQSKPYEVQNVGERPLISEDDYFLRADEFRVWLKICKNCSFESLQSSEAHAHFNAFIHEWNSGQLLPMYYYGIPPELKDSCLKTTHRWNFQLTDSEKTQVLGIADDVERKTNRNFDNAWQHMAPPTSTSAASVTSHLKRNRDATEDILAREEQYEQRKRQAHKDRAFASVVLDEVAPKETGREALIDKRREIGEKLKGAARDAHEGRDGLDVSESFTMGGGGDFASVKARRDESRRNREAAKMDRISELVKKEESKQADFMNKLGIDLTKGKITIAPRRDN